MATTSEVQEKYTKIMNIMLNSINQPLDNCVQVLERIDTVMNLKMGPLALPDQAPENAQLLITTLSKADSITKALLRLEQELDAQEIETEVFLTLHGKDVNIHNLPELHRFIDSICGEGDEMSKKAIKKQIISETIVDGNTVQVYRDALTGKIESGIYDPQTGNITTLQDLEKNKEPKELSYDDYYIEDARKTPAKSFSYGDENAYKSLHPKPAPDLSAYRPKKSTMTEPMMRQSITGPISDSAVVSIETLRSSNPEINSSGEAPGSEEELDINMKPEDVVIPKWTKGPPTTSDEIEEYKNFMVMKYEAEQKQNALILARRKAGL